MSARMRDKAKLAAEKAAKEEQNGDYSEALSWWRIALQRYLSLERCLIAIEDWSGIHNQKQVEHCRRREAFCRHKAIADEE